MSSSAEAPGGSLLLSSPAPPLKEDADENADASPPAPSEQDSSSAASPPTPGSPPATPPPPPQPSTPPPSSESPPPSSPPPWSPPPTPSSPPPSPQSDSPTPRPPAPATASPPPPPGNSPEPKPSSPPPPSTTTSPPPPSTTTSPPPSPTDKATPPPSTVHPSPPPPHTQPSAPPVNASASPPPPGAVVVLVSPPPPVELVPSPAPPLVSGTPNLTPPSTTSPPLGNSPTHSPPKSGSHSPSVTGNRKASSSPSADGSGDSSGDATNKAIVGTTVAGVFIIALIALIFLARRRKKRKESYATYYMPPNNFTVKTADGFYYGQQPNSMGLSGPGNHSSGSQQPHSTHADNSYGSQRGNMFSSGGAESGVIGGSKSFFTYEDVMEMTDGFSRQNIIGEGGFGCVYKGTIADGRAVAVKQLKAGSGQGDREFKAEVEIISRVHHRHLVSLVGYCIADHQRLLIYEFVPNKTLEHHLHTKEMPVLDWPKRLKIAIGSAKGLAYLHEDCHPKIIHRDIKSANILLDDAFEAQVADFGLARLNDTTQTHVSTRVMGTFGYLAPEYASSGKLTDRSDVYSFGVVLLELITGRKPVDPTQPLGDESLVEWARPLLIQALETGDLSELVDPRLEKHYVESEMIRMVETAAACVRHSAPKRPRMVQVVRALDCESEMSDLTNGVKYGQSTVYDSGQYNQEIMKFRRMAIGSSGDSSEFDTFSGDATSRDVSREPLTSSDFTSEESETRAMTRPRNHGMQGNYGARHFL